MFSKEISCQYEKDVVIIMYKSTDAPEAQVLVFEYFLEKEMGDNAQRFPESTIARASQEKVKQSKRLLGRQFQQEHACMLCGLAYPFGCRRSLPN